MIVLALDPVAARHLVAALGRHVQRCERDGFVVPAQLRELFVLAVEASSRPSGAVGGHDSAGEGLAADDRLVAHGVAARRLGVSLRTVRRRVAAGELVAVGRRITLASLEALEAGGGRR
ncbi:hypothetical protein [Micromonospora aurantiaca (nom. illeg.)]|uniref:hypothetical protein n=1 Tax=Micromonospora aurantiaca (nom. illeg.) TaxID=47850 RepID=UPI001622BA7E